MENVENQIEKSESVQSANVPSKKGKKKIQKKEQTDSINLSKVKISLKGIDKSKFDKEGSVSQKDIYLGMDGLSQDERKRRRSKIRRERTSFINQILGKDRKDEERIDSIGKFIDWYKLNYRITDFKIDNFMQGSNEIDRKDCKNLLDVVRKSLG